MISRVLARSLFSHLPSSSAVTCVPIDHRRRFSVQSAISVVPDYLTHWSVTQFCQWAMESVHVYTGLPWWATIVGATMAFKVLTSPLLYASERAVARHALMKALVKRMVPEMKTEIDRLAKIVNLSEEKKQLWLKMGVKKAELVLTEQMKCHRFTMVCWPLLQAPVWIGMSFAIRNITGRNPLYLEYDDLVVEEMATQGLYWFSNLTVPDPLLILPVINCVLYLLAPTIFSLGVPAAAKKTLFYRINRGVNIAVTGLITYVGIYCPAVVVLYWTTSMLLTLLLRLILKFPQVRRTLAIDRAPFESKTPIRELMGVNGPK